MGGVKAAKELGRLRRKGEFRRVFDEGTAIVGRSLVLRACPVDAQVTRVGFVVSRKLGGAVQRNRLRRRAREALRSFAGEVRSGFDLVILPRARAGECGFSQLVAELRGLLQRAGALAGEGGNGEAETGRDLGS